MNQNGDKQARPALGAADWISLAAAPSFAIMALLRGIHGGATPDMLCSATQDASPLTGMVDVFADERFPFDAMAETDLSTRKRRPPVIVQGFAPSGHGRRLVTQRQHQSQAVSGQVRFRIPR